MAVLVPQDWHPPKDHAMDSPASNTSNSSAPRQRVSPPNDSSPAVPSQISSSQNHHYPYPVQQQQAGWNAHAQPFYPAAFYQNPHQQPYPLHPSQQGQIPPHGPYFDPNAQFAQWAYQQMMFNAQQQAHQLSQHGPPSSSQRGRSSSASSPADYFAQNQLHNFNPFPSGTPPPHPSQLPNGYRPGPTSNSPTSVASTQYDGFHPYRRPNPRQASQSSSDQPPTGDWRQQAIQPPYARADAAGSTTSVNSTGSSSRQRTSSSPGPANGASGSPHHHSSSPGPVNGASGPPHHHSNNANNPSATGSVRSRNGISSQQQAHSSSASAARGGSSNPVAVSSSNSTSARPHHRNPSSSSTSSVARTPPSSHPSSSPVLHAPTPRPARPSPLSQGMSTAEKRMSRDDSELLEPLPNDAAIRSGGLKGRLRRALSLSASQTITEESSSSGGPASPSGLTGPVPGLQSNAADAGDAGSTATKQAKKKRTALFNSRLNASTDNISLSSTMSSASVVIRKLGSIGKLARRNSLAGITSLFKDKKDRDDADEANGKKGKRKKGEKSEIAEASVSHVTAELDRTSSEWSAELNGLSPAAKLARQHTLKSNAEAAAKAKAQEEAAVAAAATVTATATPAQAADPVPATWEKNTTTTRGGLGTTRVNEDGMRVVVEDDDSNSEGESEHPHDYSAHIEGWEDEDWSHLDDEEDVTIRQGLERTTLGDDEHVHEPWAIGLRRSVERVRQPSKGILKNADGYDQHSFMDTPANYSRNRSNSYNSHPVRAHELGPLARIPSPNPDHIDGLRHPAASSGPSTFLPALSFEDDEGTRPSSERTLFNHPNLNSSAPVLSTMLSSPPTLAHRSATTPVKRLAFANNLNVYDTFPSSVYDRRSEPATWSRLTPALAQRIKEELNSFKMEEMEVHAASRIHTQFFV
ncbi:hypothetical protein B0F90DRAFT_1673309 [Multifurca ochricompacta]|uniref:Uncharacterized protein n=1 Tax=Multifurca ochricompacta TaxID=376703 RepID=A0AAD4MC92_9AGAM|nr:hypothetical protein B0F90DRAFT_1673309 [Multifurca ochricompacta]